MWDADRPAAIRRSLRALGELEVEGVTTTKALAVRILESDRFASGEYSTGFLSEDGWH